MQLNVRRGSLKFMSMDGATSSEEALLLLRKWHEERTQLYVVLSEGDFRFNMPGVITELASSLVITHPRGRGDGYLKCFWSDVLAFAYTEMREDAERLAGYPGGPEFMRNRSILAISVKQDLLLRLVDLTLDY